MSVWFGAPTLELIEGMGSHTLNAALGIEITELTEYSIMGRMPVDERTVQPAGVLHGGASVAFSETLASWGAHFAIDRSRQHAVGQEINANHVRPAGPGWVHGEATPVALGRRSQVWDVRITDEAGKLVCISRCTIAVLEVPSQYGAPEQRA